MPTVSFRREDGARLAVMGLSGGGKTPLLRAIADPEPSADAVSLAGAD